MKEFIMFGNGHANITGQKCQYKWSQIVMEMVLRGDLGNVFTQRCDTGIFLCS